MWKTNKKIFITTIVLVIVMLMGVLSGLVMLRSSISSHAQEFLDGDIANNYVVYDESYNYLFEKSKVELGDMYISKDYKKYEVIFINQKNRTGVAKFIEQMEKPKIKFSTTPSRITQKDRKIALYCTHNDESYLPSEGYYTIYGKGGIHDIAKRLKINLENYGVNVNFDETLHLPHDSKAYSRSGATASNLLKDKPDALFDIHRDGVSRKFYATTVDGVERSKIRIVVGKSSANFKANEEFALYLRAVADEMYPWLISDIYYASGHYNQGLYEKALLFEMGTYLIEKELVLKSVEPLSHVINVALYNTTVDLNTGELEIGGTPTSEKPNITDLFKLTYPENNKFSLGGGMFVVSFMLFMAVMLLYAFLIVYNMIRDNNQPNKPNIRSKKK